MAVTKEIENFYTWGSFLSLSVAAGAVWTVAGALSYAFTWSYPRYFPLLLAAVFSIMGDLAANAGPKRKPLMTRFPLWLLNACLIYTTALGGSELAKNIPQDAQLAEVKNKTNSLSQTLTDLKSQPGLSNSPEIQAAAKQIDILSNCLTVGDKVGPCAEKHPLQSPLATIDLRKIPPDAVVHVVSAQKKASSLNQNLAIAKGDFGFSRLGASVERRE